MNLCARDTVQVYRCRGVAAHQVNYRLDQDSELQYDFVPLSSLVVHSPRGAEAPQGCSAE